MKNVKFREIPREKDEFHGEIPRLKAAAKTQTPRVGSKFRGGRKNVGPTNHHYMPSGEELAQSFVHLFIQCEHLYSASLGPLLREAASANQSDAKLKTRLSW